MLSAFNCSLDPLINNFAWFFRNFSCSLCQLLRYSWYVTAWMHILQPHIIWCHCVIFCDCGGRSHWISESIIYTIPLLSYSMKIHYNISLSCLYAVHIHMLGESLYDVVQSLLFHLHHQNLLKITIFNIILNTTWMR